VRDGTAAGASVGQVTMLWGRMGRGRGALALLVALGLAAACSGGDDAGSDADAAEDAGPAGDVAAGDDAADEVVFPGAEWARASDADEVGFDAAALEAIAADAEAAGSNCLLVTRGGEIAAEWYWNDTDAGSVQEVFSVTKSLTSTLVGIAQDDGALDVDDEASEYIDDWVGTESEDVTVANLVSNDSGREWSLEIDYGQLPGQPDLDGFATGLGQDAPPGETWAYNNSAIQTLDVVLREATGQDTHDFAAERVFAPIGMDDSLITTDDSGNTRTFMGLQSTCEDLARFGYLFLRGGEWDGTQVVSEEWVDAAVGQPSQELNSAYGYLWWLNRPGPQGGALQATAAEDDAGDGAGGDEADGDDSAEGGIGQLVSGAPDDMFFALGLGNQVVAVDPGSDTVVVRLGRFETPEGAKPFDAAATARVVTEALADPDA
jgi:CubicO group peptidase (beta-lactamase class C family)